MSALWRPIGPAAALLLAVVQPAAGQTDTASGTPGIGGPVASSLAAAAIGVTPILFHINESAPTCAPCPITTVPGFDRWVIRPENQGLSLASDLALVGLGAATLWDMSRRDNGLRRVATSVESAAWAFGLSQITKAVVARKRPVLYTADAMAAAADVGAQRSLPSGHTAVAFALATSYWLDARDRGGPEPWLAVGGAVIVAVGRVAAAKHFPSDVVVGAALGATTALVVRRIRF